jgi:hypothetical protein
VAGQVNQEKRRLLPAERFNTKGEARRAAVAARMTEAWSIEFAEKAKR